MTKKELKDLLAEKQDDMTQEEDDNLIVMFSSDGDFYIPSVEDSGFTEFLDECDKDGNVISEGVKARVFALVTSELKND